MQGDMALVAFLAAAPFAVIAAYLDIKTMLLPHWLAPAAAAVFAVIIFTALPVDEAINRVIGAVFVLVVGFLLFWANAMGGGDVKLMSAYALMIAPIDASFVMVVLAATALLTIGVFFLLRVTRLVDGEGSFWRRDIPYAVPLSLTLMIYLALVAFLVN